MKRLVIAAVLVLWALPVLGQMADPGDCTTFRRVTASGGSQVLNETTCRGIYYWPSGRDSTGAKAASDWAGGAYSQWCSSPDSTDVYDFCFRPLLTTGDSIIVGHGERRTIWGPGLRPARGSVGSTALELDAEGRFAPGVTIQLADGDTLNSEEEIVTTAGVVLDTLATLVQRWSHGGSVGSQIVLSDINDRVTLRADSVSSHVAWADTACADSAHVRAMTVGDGGSYDALGVDGLIWSSGDVEAYDDVIAHDDVTAQGGTVTAGASGAAGSIVISDGSSNTVTYTATGLSSDVTITVKGTIFKGDVTYSDTSSPYRKAFYYPGMTANHRPLWSIVDQPTGTYLFPAGTVRCIVGCKTDSLVVASSTSSGGDILIYFKAEIP